MKTTVKLITVLIVIFAIVAVSLYAISLYNKATTRDSQVDAGTIVHWSDGDTAILDDGTYVRLILIDTPESVSPENDENSPEGKAASNWVKREFPVPFKVWMTYDVERQDRYGRTLAYVWDTDPSGHFYDDEFVRVHMLNARILASGYATIMQVKPNGEPYIALFRKLESESRMRWSAMLKN